MKTKLFLACGAIAAALSGVSCASLPPDQVMRNDQTRFEQQLQRYPERESSAQQKAAEAQLAQEKMANKR